MATDHAPPPPPADTSPLRVLLPQVLPALVVGVAASLLFLGIEALSEELQDVLWNDLPDALGIGDYSSLWIISMLTAAGIAVGLVIWKVPGHAGPDPAALGLGGAPLAPGVVPSLLLASTLTLAGGVSLGPENPIIEANIALAYWLGRKAAPTVPGAFWVALASAATIGALFGTPVAAALVISEALVGQPGRGSLWDRLFAPLVAAGAGSMTTQLLAEPTFDMGLPPLTDPGWGDLLAALMIASAAAVFGLAACYLFPYVHSAFQRLRHPMVMLPVGGLVLGLLGAVGGQLTLFKGLDEVKELASSIGSWSSGELAKLAVIKVLALLVAASCGFRGGRIFPAVFIGAAFGLLAQALVPEVHPAVAVSSAVLGVLLATTRQGWISLFVGAVLAASPSMLALLCLASLPAWLIVTGRPQLELDAQGKSLH
ncbi:MULTISPECIES: ion channel protein [unclassified Streptomyces]|uniref:ion channel protein n=1 Tax=unclassified Streptomyces TaxID=2593676 RepID=UPI0016556C1F|nr:ion channel protein [Streptomyces sp. CB02980]MCB8902180.1 ion channel protein [Streptomyces sp. CB02980]